MALWEKFNIRDQAFLTAFFAWMEAQPEIGDPVPQPDPEPIPVPVPTNIQRQIIERAWADMGVARNPDSAFYRAAAGMSMGAPIWNESRLNGYAWQPFAGGILYCKEGDWANVQELDWYDDGVMRLCHPIADASKRRVTQGWGERPEYYSQYSYGGVPLKGHNGIDYGLTVGNTIVACDGGTVREAQYDAGGWGIYVKLIHTWGESLYAHLMSMDVAQGDTVMAGQKVGQSGNTGNSTGAHLHFGIRINPYRRDDGWGGFSDPAPYLQ